MKLKSKKRKSIKRWEWALGALLFFLGIALSLAVLPNLPGARALLAQNESTDTDRTGGGEENDGNSKDTSGSGTEENSAGDNGSGSGTDRIDVEKLKAVLTDKVIVIDPGHGGIDPGKVGIHGELEKDINLSIAEETAELLEKAGATVVCTRTEDCGLYGESDSNKKLADLKARCERIAAADPDIAVSIHQNSYTDASISGAQVFYYEGSENGKKLALSIQSALVAYADPENRRQVKSDNSYYILLHSVCPTVIVECGFLSNDAEAAKLATEEYRILIAEAIVRGIAEYFS